jgi:hypothetical protein
MNFEKFFEKNQEIMENFNELTKYSFDCPIVAEYWVLKSQEFLLFEYTCNNIKLFFEMADKLGEVIKLLTKQPKKKGGMFRSSRRHVQVSARTLHLQRADDAYTDNLRVTTIANTRLLRFLFILLALFLSAELFRKVPNVPDMGRLPDTDSGEYPNDIPSEVSFQQSMVFRKMHTEVREKHDKYHSFCKKNLQGAEDHLAHATLLALSYTPNFNASNVIERCKKHIKTLHDCAELGKEYLDADIKLKKLLAFADLLTNNINGATLKKVQDDLISYVVGKGHFVPAVLSLIADIAIAANNVGLGNQRIYDIDIYSKLAGELSSAGAAGNKLGDVVELLYKEIPGLETLTDSKRKMLAYDLEQSQNLTLVGSVAQIATVTAGNIAINKVTEGLNGLSFLNETMTTIRNVANIAGASGGDFESAENAFKDILGSNLLSKAIQNTNYMRLLAKALKDTEQGALPYEEQLDAGLLLSIEGINLGTVFSSVEIFLARSEYHQNIIKKAMNKYFTPEEIKSDPEKQTAAKTGVTTLPNLVDVMEKMEANSKEQVEILRVCLEHYMTASFVPPAADHGLGVLNKASAIMQPISPEHLKLLAQFRSAEEIRDDAAEGAKAGVKMLLEGSRRQGEAIKKAFTLENLEKLRKNVGKTIINVGKVTKFAAPYVRDAAMSAVKGITDSLTKGKSNHNVKQLEEPDTIPASSQLLSLRSPSDSARLLFSKPSRPASASASSPGPPKQKSVSIGSPKYHLKSTSTSASASAASSPGPPKRKSVSIRSLGSPNFTSPKQKGGKRTRRKNRRSRKNRGKSNKRR